MNWQEFLFAGYTPVQLLVIAGAATVATVVQASAGFGFALLALPVILRVGVPLQEAVVFIIEPLAKPSEGQSLGSITT